eukprot:c15313_g1_i1.p1 GENE.c15313_g1_i1~~c15313_g1_i1.p1  ORF type:complete len:526 (-),score=136.11 c15313_g1_i1:154-1731(-)
MANDNIGFDVDRFTAVPPDFVCSVCGGVFNNPKQTPCGHLFCHDCISRWLASHNTCPLCNHQPIQTSNITRPAFALINLIKALNIRCLYVDKGCANPGLTLEIVAAHEVECGHGPAQCAHAGCPRNQQGSLKRMELAAHTAQCEWRLVECPHSCGARRMPAKDVQRHVDSTCPNMRIPCSLGCGQAVMRAQMRSHHDTVCSMFVIGCCVERCEFRSARGASAVWDKHMQDAAANHVVLAPSNIALRAVNQLVQKVQALPQQQQRNTINELRASLNQRQQTIDSLQELNQQQTQTIRSQQQTIAQQANTLSDFQVALEQQRKLIEQFNQTTDRDSLQLVQRQARVLYLSQLVNNSFHFPFNFPTSESAPRSVDLVVRGVTSQWSTGFETCSPEMKFNHIPELPLRYSFVIKVKVNHDNCRDHIGVGFIPVRGPNHRALNWPIVNHIKIEVLSVTGTQNKQYVLDSSEDKKWLAKHNPPTEHNTDGRGCPNLLTRQHDDFVLNDAMVVRCSLLDTTFAKPRALAFFG